MINLLFFPAAAAPTSSRHAAAATDAAVYRIDFDDLKCDKDYKPLLSYARSKLANMLFTRELASRLKGGYQSTKCAQHSTDRLLLSLSSGISVSQIQNFEEGEFFKVQRFIPTTGPCLTASPSQRPESRA